MNDLQTRKNQFVFREVNERIAEITKGQKENYSGFLCECGQLDCTSIIELGLRDYGEIRRRSEIFIAAPGHCVEGVDRLVESRSGLDLLAQI